LSLRYDCIHFRHVAWWISSRHSVRNISFWVWQKECRRHRSRLNPPLLAIAVRSGLDIRSLLLKADISLIVSRYWYAFVGGGTFVFCTRWLWHRARGRCMSRGRRNESGPSADFASRCCRNSEEECYVLLTSTARRVIARRGIYWSIQSRIAISVFLDDDCDRKSQSYS